VARLPVTGFTVNAVVIGRDDNEALFGFSYAVMGCA